MEQFRTGLAILLSPDGMYMLLIDGCGAPRQPLRELVVVEIVYVTSGGHSEGHLQELVFVG